MQRYGTGSDKSLMKKKFSKTMAIMVFADILMIIITVLSGLLSRKYNQVWMLTLYVTFLTISYHFVMRLMVGEIVTVRYKNRKFNLNSAGFRVHKFEAKLYKRLNVKKRKKNIITAKPEQFDISKNNMEDLLHNIAQAELVHRIIMVLSFVPLALIIPYGAPMVFITTSIFSCLIDLQFVMIQRYNRPRVIKLMEKQMNRVAITGGNKSKKTLRKAHILKNRSE